MICVRNFLPHSSRPARDHGLRADESRQGRKAATVVRPSLSWLSGGFFSPQNPSFFGVSSTLEWHCIFELESTVICLLLRAQCSALAPSSRSLCCSSAFSCSGNHASGPEKNLMRHSPISWRSTVRDPKLQHPSLLSR